MKLMLFIIENLQRPNECTDPRQRVITSSNPALWNHLSYRSGIGINGIVLTYVTSLPYFLPLLHRSKALQGCDKNVTLRCLRVAHTHT